MVDNYTQNKRSSKVIDKCPYDAVDTTKLELRLSGMAKDHSDLKNSYEESQKMLKEIHDYILNQKASVFGFKLGFKSAFVVSAAFFSGMVAFLTGKFSLKDILSLFS